MTIVVTSFMVSGYQGRWGFVFGKLDGGTRSWERQTLRHQKWTYEARTVCVLSKLGVTIFLSNGVVIHAVSETVSSRCRAPVIAPISCDCGRVMNENVGRKSDESVNEYAVCYDRADGTGSDLTCEKQILNLRPSNNEKMLSGILFAFRTERLVPHPCLN